MKYRSGYFIIELMMYITLGLFIMIMTCQILLRFIAYVRFINRDSFDVIKLYGASRAVERDLEQAPVSVDHWLPSDGTKIKWIHGNKRITWKIKNEALKRMVAHFNEKDRRWKKEGSAIMAKNLAHGLFEIHKNDKEIDQISYELQLKDGPLFKQTIWPMIGRVLR